MSKELEALERIGKLEIVVGLRVVPTKTIVKDFADYYIIETALKRLEEIEQKYNELLYDYQELVHCGLKSEQKKLKALEVIKEKNVDVGRLKHSICVAINNKATMVNAATKEFIEPYIYYNFSRPKNEWLTQEEYNLLKELLK